MVLRLQKAGVSLDLEEQLTHPRSPLRSVLLNTILSPRLGSSTFVLQQKDETGQITGLAQIRARPGRSERVIVFMSPGLNHQSGSHAIWQRLITHLCVYTAAHGTHRVYVRLPLEGQESQLFKNMGFQDYCHETIFKLAPSTPRKTPQLSITLRPQHPNDSWGLQKLYATLTPRSIQHAEGLAQGQWELAKHRLGEQGRRFGYVWEVDGELLGALHLRAGKNGYWVRTLLHPNLQGQNTVICQAILQLTAAKPHLPVYFAVRQYEGGWDFALSELGFEPLTSQMLMVKAMTIRVREQTPSVLPTLEGSKTEGAAPSMMTRGNIMLEKK
jgi:hypothetical protein